MIAPSSPVIAFENDEQKLSFLKKWKLIPPKATEPKQLYYNGLFSDGFVACDVVGYMDDMFLVIFINGQLHTIHHDYLHEMQPTKKELASIDAGAMVSVPIK